MLVFLLFFLTLFFCIFTSASLDFITANPWQTLLLFLLVVFLTGNLPRLMRHIGRSLHSFRVGLEGKTDGRNKKG